MDKKTVGNMIAAVVACVMGMPAVADIATDMITSEAVFWFDASTLDVAVGTELDSWADVRGESYPAMMTYTAIRPQVIEIADGDLAGKKAVTFFTAGTACDMQLDSRMQIQTAFFVTDIDMSGDAYLLGDSSGYEFARGTGGSWGTLGSYQYPGINSVCWNDGVKVADPQTTAIPTGYQLITWQLNSGSANVKHMGQDRTIPGRVGGKRLCEVITFNRLLGDIERSAIEGYLKAKWWGSNTFVAAAIDMAGRKAQVHFDAANADSFHYDVDGDTTGTKVLQWDDLSGNGRHLIAFQFDPSNPKYPTRDIIHYAPALNLGAFGSALDMRLADRITTTRAVFMVAEVDRHQRVYWLGDDTDYHFARGNTTTEGAYAFNGSPINTMGSIYRNGKKIVSPTTQYPDAPGGFSVYAFNITQNCSWQHLCRDRQFEASSSSGGKRIAELITFDTTFADADREILEKLLMEKWCPTDAYVDALIATAAVHTDSSSPDNFTYANGKITGWKNDGDGADLFKPETLYNEGEAIACNFGGYGFTNGVPAFLMGGSDSRIDLAFTRLKNVRSVFWAMDIESTSEAPFLGDGANNVYVSDSIGDWKWHFCRGYGSDDKGVYFSRWAAANALKFGPLFCDGLPVVSATEERPPLGLHVYDVTSQDDLTASSLSVDRWCPPRNGGRAISELLIFTNAVSGLTQDMIRDRLEKKWTRRCGWAGAGDAEWGADKYRVFGADATVSAEGASVNGIGFTANATLSGGTLTLGDGGIFASEGSEVTISVPLAGVIRIYGPGKVTLASSLDAVDSLLIGYGATLVMSPNGTVHGGLSIQEGGRIVLNVSSLAPNEHASVTFDGGMAFPSGGDIHDYISTSSTEGYALTLSEDGKILHVNAPFLVVSAVWNADVDADVKNPANWTCSNLEGDVLDDALPGGYTKNVTLNADCDLRAWGTPVFGTGTVIDLNGHNLKVMDLSDESYTNAVIRNSNPSMTSELHVEVTNGKTAKNTSISIEGDIKLVKEGAGTYVAAKNGQTYTGGTDVMAGILKDGAGGLHLGGYVAPGTVTVFGDGTEIGVYDINGLYAQARDRTDIVLAGGTLYNAIDVFDIYGQMTNMVLKTDSKIMVNGNFGFWWGVYPTIIDLGGHSLDVEITNGKHLMFCFATIKNGTMNLNGEGSIQFGGADGKTGRIDATSATLRVNCPIAMDLDADVSVDVRDYHALYTGTVNSATNPLNVYGTFKPSEHNCFYGCTMQNGSTIDLSARTNALPIVSSFTTGANTLTFADQVTVTVDLSGHSDFKTFMNGYLMTWSDIPSANFVLDAQTKKRGFTVYKANGGLKLTSNATLLIVR